MRNFQVASFFLANPVYMDFTHGIYLGKRNDFLFVVCVDEQTTE